MKTRHDPIVDALSVQLTDATVEASEEVRPGVVIDYDADERVLGCEILYVRDTFSVGTDRPQALGVAA